MVQWDIGSSEGKAKQSKRSLDEGAGRSLYAPGQGEGKDEKGGALWSKK